MLANHHNMQNSQSSEFNQIKLVGFDLGETLVYYLNENLNWSGHYGNALKKIADNLRIELDDKKLEEATKILSAYNTRKNPRIQEIKAKDIFTEILNAWDFYSENNLESAVKIFFAYFQKDVRAYAETEYTLKSLKERGIKIAVLTDVPYGMPKELVEEDMERTGIKSYIDHLLTSVEVGFRKPHTAGYLALSKLFDADPANIIYVGNERKDIEGANNAGIVSILINRGYDNLDFGQTETVKRLDEVLKIF